jgi:cell division septum initiation protein DivIVA
MSDVKPEPPDLQPADLSQANFTRSRKGLEPAQVRTMLGRAEDALRVWASRDAAMQAELEDLRRRVEAAEDLDEAKVTEMLGAHTAKIVTAAREAAEEIRSSAEEESTRLLDEARSGAEELAQKLRTDAEEAWKAASEAKEQALTEAEQLLSEAKAEAEESLAVAREAAESLTSEAEDSAAETERKAAEKADELVSGAQSRHDDLIAAASSIFDENTAQAEEASAAIRKEAEQDAAAIQATAAEELEAARGLAEIEIENARERGREMIAETKEVRERILQDMAVRRRAAKQKMEAARAAHVVMVESLESTTQQLSAALDEARGIDSEIDTAADSASFRVLNDVDSFARKVAEDLDTGNKVEVDADEVSGAASDSDSDADADADAGGSDSDASDAETDGAAGVSAADALEGDGEVGGTSLEAVSSDPEAAEVDDTGDAESSTGEGSVGADDAEDIDTTDGPAGAPESDAGPEPAAAEAESAGAEAGSASVHDIFEKMREGSRDEAEGAVHPSAADDNPDPSDDDPQTSPPVGVKDANSAPAEVIALNRTGGGTGFAPAGTAAEGNTGGVATLVPPAEATDGDLLDRRDELLAPAEQLMARALKRLISDEQNEVLDRARRVKRGRPDLEELTGHMDSATFADALRNAFLLSAAAGAQMWCELTGAALPEISSDDVSAALESRLEELFENRQVHLRGVLENMDNSGEDASALVDRLRASYREMRSTSVPDQAGDLAVSGFTEGIVIAAGSHSTWRWVADNGGLPCSDAEDNSLAGPIACGAEFPTGDDRPPAHPGCRCILAPGT